MLKQLVLGGALLAVWVAACSSSTSNEFDCAVGHARCTCYANATCADGLACNDMHQCVAPGTSRGGSAGDAGKGSVATSGTNAMGGSESQGGTQGGNATAAGSSSGGKGNGASKAGKGNGASKAGKGNNASTGGSSRGGTGSSSGGMSGGESGMVSVSAGGTGEGAAAGAGADAGASGAGAGDGGNAGTPSEGGTGGTGGSGAGTGGSAGTSGTAGGGAGGSGGAGCTELDVGTAIYSINLASAPDIANYVYRPGPLGGAGTDYFEVEFYASGFGPMRNGENTGTFTLGTGRDANVQTCSRCLLVDEDVSQGNANVTYFATAGTMLVADGSDQMNGQPLVTLTDVTLREVTLNPVTRRSTLVTNGRCLHLATASVRIPAAWACPISWYSTNDGCDCGCGAHDGDCATVNVSVCDGCFCGGDLHDCENVSTTENGVCQ